MFGFAAFPKKGSLLKLKSLSLRTLQSPRHGHGAVSAIRGLAERLIGGSLVGVWNGWGCGITSLWLSGLLWQNASFVLERGRRGYDSARIVYKNLSLTPLGLSQTALSVHGRTKLLRWPAETPPPRQETCRTSPVTLCWCPRTHAPDKLSLLRPHLPAKEGHVALQGLFKGWGICTLQRGLGPRDPPPPLKILWRSQPQYFPPDDFSGACKRKAMATESLWTLVSHFTFSPELPRIKKKQPEQWW